MGKGNYASLNAGLLARKGEAKPAANSVFGHDGLISKESIEDSDQGAKQPSIGPAAAAPAVHIRSVAVDGEDSVSHDKPADPGQVEHLRQQIVRELSKGEDAATSGSPTANASPEVTVAVQDEKEELHSASSIHRENDGRPSTVSRIVKPNFGLRRRVRQSVTERTPAIASGVSHSEQSKNCEKEKTCDAGAAVHSPTVRHRAAFTLMLDERRHLTLKMICMKLGVSGQTVLTQALDAYVDERLANELSECSCLKKLVANEMEEGNAPDE